MDGQRRGVDGSQMDWNGMDWISVKGGRGCVTFLLWGGTCTVYRNPPRGSACATSKDKAFAEAKDLLRFFSPSAYIGSSM